MGGQPAGVILQEAICDCTLKRSAKISS